MAAACAAYIGNAMFLPTRKLLILLVLPVFVLVFFPGTTAAALAAGYDVALLLVAAMTVPLSVRPGQIDIQRRLPAHLSLGVLNQVGWDIRNSARAAAV